MSYFKFRAIRSGTSVIKVQFARLRIILRLTSLRYGLKGLSLRMQLSKQCALALPNAAYTTDQLEMHRFQGVKLSSKAGSLAHLLHFSSINYNK